MEQHICLICIGSNTNREANILLAQQYLRIHFPSIILGSEQDTSPLFYSNPAHFTNQVATFSTSLSKDEVITIFKEIERESGRLPNDKSKEIVKLDVDLLIYDKQVLKPKDLQREYIISGINELKMVER